MSPTPITKLETAIEERETTLPFDEAPGVEGTSAVLVEIRADVGERGGSVRLGSSPDSLGHELMWAPASPGNDERRALVLIEPGAQSLGYLRYEGGSVLSAQVVGYFTGENSEGDTSGLYLPSGPSRIFDGTLSPVEVQGLDSATAVGFVTVGSATAILGQIGSVVLPVSEGALTLRADLELEVTVTLMGEFL